MMQQVQHREAKAGRRKSLVRSVPIEDWPAADRRGWETACRRPRRLVRGGAASHLGADTRSDLARRYGYYLDFLNRSGQLDLEVEATALVTPEAVAAFITELQSRVRSVTVSRTIYKLRRAAECITPDRDFTWLAEIEKDLVLLERPKDKFDRLVTTECLVRAGVGYFRQAEGNKSLSPFARALAARNGLMVALLALDPIRLRNFATLEIGSNFVSLDGKWWIVLDDTKSGRPDHRPVPVLLTPLIARYLELHRVILCGDETPRRRRQVQASTAPRPDRTKALWISRFAGPLSYSAVERVITETTRVLTGRPMSPHLFRAAAATSAALSLSPHLASALLQHADSRVTEEHYNRASSLSVARDFAALIGRMR